ncbi:hypothetical protein Tco_0320574 [Tanacetum coccineum]
MASLDRRFEIPFTRLKSVRLGGKFAQQRLWLFQTGGLGRQDFVSTRLVSKRPLKLKKFCLDCARPVPGLFCRQCALIRETLEEVFQVPRHFTRHPNDSTNFVIKDHAYEVIKSSVEDLVPIPSETKGIPDSVCDVPLCNNPTPLEAFKKIWTIIDSNNDSSSSDDDSYENIDYVDASPPDAEIVSLEAVEIVIPEVGGIDTDILLTIKDDILCEKFLPPQSLNLDSWGRLTPLLFFTHGSRYVSFIFDLSINPTDRSDFYHEEFADELAYIISPSEYDHFCFKIEPELGNLTMDVVEDIFQTREPRVHVPNVLTTHPTLHLDTDFILLSEPLFAYIVWIFLPFLTYLVAPPYLLSCGNEDTIFDPGISIYHSFLWGLSIGVELSLCQKPGHLADEVGMCRDESRYMGFIGAVEYGALTRVDRAVSATALYLAFKSHYSGWNVKTLEYCKTLIHG